MKAITFGGGCFWGVQNYFKLVKGVVKTSVGYAMGEIKFPTYEIVCSGESGHAEVCKVDYDSSQTNLYILLTHFFHIVDPTLLNQQAGDIGTQYRSGIYYSSNEEKDLIKKFIDNIQKIYPDPIVVEVKPMEEFWDAEEYHQDYLEKNQDGYCHLDFSKYKNINKVDCEARKLYL